MAVLELLKDMKRNMEGVGSIAVPYHISQIDEAIVEVKKLREGRDTANMMLYEISESLDCVKEYLGKAEQALKEPK